MQNGLWGTGLGPPDRADPRWLDPAAVWPSRGASPVVVAGEPGAVAGGPPRQCGRARHWLGAFSLRLADSLSALWPPLTVLALLESLAHAGSLAALVAFLAALLWGLQRLSSRLRTAAPARAWTLGRSLLLGSGVLMSVLAGLTLLTGPPGMA